MPWTGSEQWSSAVTTVKLPEDLSYACAAYGLDAGHNADSFPYSPDDSNV